MKMLTNSYMPQNWNKAVTTILLPNMGEGIMPDIIPVKAALEGYGVNVIDCDLSIANALRELTWADIDLVDFRYARGSLTNFEKYMGLVDRVMDKIHDEFLKGHEVTILPGYDEIKWISSKENYFSHLEKFLIPIIPTRFIHRHSQRSRASTVDPDNLDSALEVLMSLLEQGRGRKFVMKPSISSLAKKIIFIDCEDNGSFSLKFPYIDRDSYSIKFDNLKNLSVLLRHYLEHTSSPDETFLLQDFVDNLEISAVFIDGRPHFVQREPGAESHVAHCRYGGKDKIIENPDHNLVSFVQSVYATLPHHIQNSPFLRIDVMWDHLQKKYVFGEIEGAGATRLWIEDAGRVDDYARMLVKLSGHGQILAQDFQSRMIPSKTA